MSILKNIFQKERVKLVDAILYPDKIIVESLDKIKGMYWIRSEHLAKINSNSSDQEIGEMVQKHLSYSRYNIKKPRKEESQRLRKIYQKKTGLKTYKAEMHNAALVSVELSKDGYEIMPSKNGGRTGADRGYQGLDEKSLVLDKSVSSETLGEHIRRAWNECEFI